MLIYACSTNRGKLDEFALAAAESGLAQLSIQPFPRLATIPAPEESGSTFEENASLKAVYYSRFTAEVVLADDSGIEVDALCGEPGVYSARYSGTNATDTGNNDLLLRNLGSSKNRAARFVCVIALAQAGRILTSCKGVVEGEILAEPRGSNGFGYDPLFFYPPFGRAFAELSRGEKWSVSHRGKAMRAVLRELPRLFRDPA